MKKSTTLFFLFVALISWQCTEDNQASQSDHPPLIFGSNHGFCLGNCAHLFKYENGEVFRDEMDKLEVNFVFSDTPDPELLESAQRILEDFPEELKVNSQETYGCPDCADQGTLILQLTEGDGTRRWYLDTRIQEDWSQDLKDFVDLLKKELEEIIIL